MANRILLTFILFILGLIPAGAFDESDSPSAAITIPQLKESVRIYRDNFGTPYIVAENEHDLFFAHGYMQAMDRLFQLDGTRRVPQGRTSEVVGDQQLSMDMFFAQLGLDKVAEKSLELVDDDTLMMLQAFSDGVNAYLDDCKDTLPLEFKLMGYEPEQWKPVDSLLVMRLISWWLSVGMYQEMFFDDLVQQYGYDVAIDLFPGVPCRADIEKAAGEVVLEKPKPLEEKIKPFKPYKWRIPSIDRANAVKGTNCWVVSGKKTKSGMPILANDPHLELFSPSIWYEIGLSCPEWTSVGVVFPGLPIQQIGTNGYIAWGAAAFPADTQDLYRQKLNPDNENQYEHDGKWMDYEIEEKKIPVKGGESVSITVLISEQGPVVQTGEKENLALAWTGFEPSEDISSFKNAVLAKDINQFSKAFDKFEAIPQHFFAFDLKGNIIHVQPGRFPVRENCNGDLPVSGSDSDVQWVCYLPPDKIPDEINPVEGFLNNSNNFPPCDTGYDLGTTFPLPSRFERVRELLSARNDLTVDDMAKMQMDLLNPVAREILPLMLAKLDLSKCSAVADEISLLKKWDYRESPDSVAATIYNQWWNQLPMDIFTPKMGFYTLSYRDYMDQFSLVLISILRDGEKAPLWKWLGIGSEENLKNLCSQSLVKAVESLKKSYRDNRTEWEWGKVHKAHFAHPSQVKFLVDGGSYGVGGSRYTINVTHYFPSSGYEANFGSSYRFIATIENGKIVARSVLPPGDLAAPLSPHFKDQAPLWASGQLKNLPVYRNEFEKLTLSLKLNPE